MSNFDKTELDYNEEQDAIASVPQAQQREDNKVSTNIGNFDDFERLDGESLEEAQHQTHHIEKEFLEEKFHQQEGKGDDFDMHLSTATHTKDVAVSELSGTNVPPSSTSNIIDFDEDEFPPIPMQRDNSPSNLEIKSSVHSSSTDRPLVTLLSDSDVHVSPDNYSFNYQQSSTTSVPETTEVHLTPDPDDKSGFGLNEPFVNVIGVDNLETEPELKSSQSAGIYPGKLYAQGYSLNPAHLDEDDDEQIVEEEGEDNVEFKGLGHQFGLESGPDVLHPSAPDLISTPYQQQQQEEEYSELNREDSPPPRYELTEDQSKFSAYIEKERSHNLSEEEPDDKGHQKLSSVTKISEETIETQSKTVRKEIEVAEKESYSTATSVSSKIEELIEELTPPFAACPSAALPCKMELSKREETHHSTATGENACMFHPRAWFNPEKLDPRGELTFILLFFFLLPSCYHVCCKNLILNEL
ncbi:hypothetical protein CHUAL_010194 [Chamberlinius hualienensis]